MKKEFEKAMREKMLEDISKIVLVESIIREVLFGEVATDPVKALDSLSDLVDTTQYFEAKPGTKPDPEKFLRILIAARIREKFKPGRM